MERTNARALAAADLPYAPDLVVVDLSFISLTKVLPAVLATAGRAPRRAGDGQAAVRGRAGRVGKGGVVRDPDLRRAALVAVASSRAALGASVLGFASSGLPGPKGNRESFVWLAEGGRAGALEDLEAAARRSSRELHRAPPRCSRTTARSRPRARSSGSSPRPASDGVALHFDPDETAKHGLTGDDTVVVDRHEARADVDLCIVLGGDGTILRGLRRYCGTAVPVFAVNFGEVGFLADARARGGRGVRLRARVRVRLRRPAPAGDRDGDRQRPVEGVQRRLGAPQDRRARRAARLRRRGRGGRLGALRRARRLHPGRLDGLQPRQRRPGAGLGRGGLRRVVHRAALADGARAGRRAGRHAERHQPRPRRRRRVDRRPPDLRDRPRRGAARALRARRRAARPSSRARRFYRRLRAKFGRLSSSTAVGARPRNKPRADFAPQTPPRTRPDPSGAAGTP